MIQKKSALFLLRCVSALLVIVMMFSAMASAAFATDWSREIAFEETLVIDGDFDGESFQLNTSSSELFNLERFAPGDEWTGRLRIKNDLPEKMMVSVISIVSILEDTALFDALDLDICLNYPTGELLYSGTYGEGQTDFFMVRPKQTVSLYITVSLSPKVGNEMQAKEMDSIWTIEGRYYNYELIEDEDDDKEYKYIVEYVDKEGNKLLPNKHGKAPFDTKVTENAPKIEGYTVDKETKSIIIKKKDNVITFIYTPIDESVPTGVDLPAQDTPLGAIAFVAALTAVCAVVTVLRIYFIKKRNKKSEE